MIVRSLPTIAMINADMATAGATAVEMDSTSARRKNPAITTREIERVPRRRANFAPIVWPIEIPRLRGGPRKRQLRGAICGVHRSWGNNNEGSDSNRCHQYPA